MEETKLAEQQPAELTEKAPATEPAATENFETIDYVKELFLNSIEQKKADKKKIRLMRFCALCMGIIALTFVVSAVLLLPQIEMVFKDVDAISQKILAIDVKAITDSAEKLMADANVTIKSAGDTIDSLDMESLNATVKELGEKVDAMDMKSLNEAIASLNEVVTKLSNFKLFG